MQIEQVLLDERVVVTNDDGSGWGLKVCANHTGVGWMMDIVTNCYNGWSAGAQNCAGKLRAAKVCGLKVMVAHWMLSWSSMIPCLSCSGGENILQTGSERNIKFYGSTDVVEATRRYSRAIDGIHAWDKKALQDKAAGLLLTKTFPSQQCTLCQTRAKTNLGSRFVSSWRCWCSPQSDVSAIKVWNLTIRPPVYCWATGVLLKMSLLKHPIALLGVLHHINLVVQVWW